MTFSQIPAWTGVGEGTFLTTSSIEMPWKLGTRHGGTAPNHVARLSGGSILENRLPSSSGVSKCRPFSRISVSTPAWPSRRAETPPP